MTTSVVSAGVDPNSQTVYRVEKCREHGPVGLWYARVIIRGSKLTFRQEFAREVILTQ
jgi:hypothetical protein